METKIHVHNKFHITLTSADGRKKQEAYAQNVVQNNFYTNLLRQGNAVMNCIAVGTGTGVPSVTDTGLFHLLSQKSTTLSSVKKHSENTVMAIRTVTFVESEANGLLTEVGLGNNSDTWAYKYWTHAMFTDAEGNVIQIEKTNTDRLTIESTVYATCEVSEPITRFGILANDRCPASFYDSVEVGGNVPAAAANYLWYIILGISNYELKYHLGLNSSGLTWSQGSGTDDVNPEQTGRRFTGNRILSDAGNLSVDGTQITYQIRSISSPLGSIVLPNHDIYPPVSLELTATGDGARTGFNFGIPILMETGVSVYIDGVLQDPQSYVWSGKDFSLRQAWCSQDDKYLVSQTGPIFTYGEYAHDYLPPHYGGIAVGSTVQSLYREFIYDFGEAKTVNALCGEVESGHPVTLSYSSDGTTWTEALVQSATRENSNPLLMDTPVSARFWKIGYSGYHTTSGMSTAYLCYRLGIGCFDYYRNQLEFSTPPAADSVIKVECQSEYPIKNSNWIVDQWVIDYAINKGE